MATNTANLDTAIANITVTLASITTNPKPTYNVDGEQVQWMEYQQMLIQQLNQLMKSRQDLDGPWIIRERKLT